MSKKLHEKEIESVIRLPAQTRYEYFLKSVANWEEVWGLKAEDGWHCVGDSSNNEYVPFWPFEVYVAIYAKDEVPDCTPTMLSTEEWIAKWLSPDTPEIGIAIFPTPFGTGIVLDRKNILSDLQYEMSKLDYEMTEMIKAELAEEERSKD